MDIFLILPNQLFENNTDYLKKFSKVYLIEEPHYFSAEIKPNRIKVSYMRACMKFYFDYLQSKNVKVEYIEFNKLQSGDYSFLKDKKLRNYSYEINDFKLENKYAQLSIDINEIETPMFLMNRNDLDSYDKKNPSHATFYEFVKSKIGLLEDVKNQDKYNRANPKNIVEIDSDLSYISKSNEKYYQEAIDYAKKSYFKDHIGQPTLENMKLYPISSKDAYKAYDYFLKNHFKNFGEFQDAIQKDNPFMYHAIISPMLNNGLLNPIQVINIIRSYDSKIPINSYEGFVRQVIGWREYMRYLYLYKYKELESANDFSNNKTLDKSWYDGSTGLLVIDSEINKAIEFGYAHHIVRLMVFLNFFILNEINPKEIYKWFMEVVSIDAYDWVMIPNIYSMGHFSSIGMRRPYLSSSNYIVKMSNYKRDGVWDVFWDEKYRSFVRSRKIGFYMGSVKNSAK